ncbi:hypothetical protein [Streptomyces niveus]|uniref:hypothetical protein n=1 Tax=Streptomyces niveus TaxID=193462 RepID=UPI003427604E
MSELRAAEGTHPVPCWFPHSPDCTCPTTALTPEREQEIRAFEEDEHRNVLTMGRALDDLLAELDRVRSELAARPSRAEVASTLYDSLAAFNAVACWDVLRLAQMRQYLAEHLADTLLADEKASTTVPPAPSTFRSATPEHDRLTLLRNAITRWQGEWATRRTLNLYRACRVGDGRHEQATADIELLHTEGFLTRHTENGGTFYTLAPAGEKASATAPTATPAEPLTPAELQRANGNPIGGA